MLNSIAQIFHIPFHAVRVNRFCKVDFLKITYVQSVNPSYSTTIIMSFNIFILTFEIIDGKHAPIFLVI